MDNMNFSAEIATEYWNKDTTNSSKIVGVHIGGVCEFKDESANLSLINVTGTSYCVKDNYLYKVFSSWENVQERLDLR